MLARNEEGARAYMLELVDRAPDGLLFKDLRLQVLDRWIIRNSRVGELAAKLRQEGLLSFPGWEARKRVPQDDYWVTAPVANAKAG